MAKRRPRGIAASDLVLPIAARNAGPETLVGETGAWRPCRRHGKGYFNDRLVETLDVMIAAPEQAGPIALVQEKVMYEFADPKLESLPVGQKMLLRMGPENARKVKAKLREIRALVASRN